MNDDMHSTDNIILLADSYKSSHHLQYPPGTTSLSSYFESRGGRFPYSVFFGLQYILKKYLCGKVVTREKINEAKELLALHMNSDSIFNEDGWKYILEHHGGCLPVKICAVPEGSVIPTHNVLFTITNTDPKVPWLVSFLETILVQCWYPMTVATMSRIQKQIIHKYLIETHDSTESLKFQLHDFGFRGVSSVESGGIGAAAHLVNFQGTDTLAGISMARKFYHCPMAGFSIPAAEHSTITTWGRKGEKEAFENLLNKFNRGLVSAVADSYDVFHATEEIFGKELKGKVIENSRNGGVLVIRPDSGDPPTIVLKTLEILEKCFGCEVNKKGFKVLPPYIRVIQGDGINYRSLRTILERLKEAGWSAVNVAFGSGGAILQKLDRDTQKCAFKCSHAVIDGASVDVFKDPVTDPGKKSKRGLLSLHRVEGGYVTKEHGEGDPADDILETVFKDGKLLKDQTFEEIRERAALSSDDFDINKFLEEDDKLAEHC